MFKRHVLALVFLIPMAAAMAQLPQFDERNSSEKKISFRPFLGRIATYTELFGVGTGHSLNIEASPIMTDLVTLNLRVGAGVPTFFDDRGRKNFCTVYGIGVELGRRRSRFVVSGGLWNVIRPPYINPYRGDTSSTKIEFNWFGSLGYRYQAPKGFFFGVNVYLMALNYGYTPELSRSPYGNEFSVWAGTYLGYRIPSWQQHKALVAYSRLSKAERSVMKYDTKLERKRDIRNDRLSDSLRIPAASRSEFGFTIFGPALISLNYTLYVPFKENGIVNYYLRSGLGTAMPLFQWNMETGMAFLKRNSGAIIGGGGSISFGSESLEAFVVVRGKVNLAKGLSGNVGIMLIWSTGQPYTFIKKEDRGHFLPSFGLSYRPAKRNR